MIILYHFYYIYILYLFLYHIYGYYIICIQVIAFNIVNDVNDYSIDFENIRKNIFSRQHKGRRNQVGLLNILCKDNSQNKATVDIFYRPRTATTKSMCITKAEVVEARTFIF